MSIDQERDRGRERETPSTYVKYSSAEEVLFDNAVPFASSLAIVTLRDPDGMQLPAQLSSQTAHGRMLWNESNRYRNVVAISEA